MSSDQHHTIEKLAAALSTEIQQSISGNDVFYALFMLYGDQLEMEWVMSVLDMDMNFESLLGRLRTFDFALLREAIFTDAELTEDIVLYQRKVQIKSHGIVWKIHLYDADPFPSQPHAHQIDENIKLDLSNGRCYRVKQYLKTLPRKALLEIRDQATKKFKGELPVLTI
jgi:hypothetical protein